MNRSVLGREAEEDSLASHKKACLMQTIRWFHVKRAYKKEKSI
jgi:hypothetical protein